MWRALMLAAVACSACVGAAPAHGSLPPLPELQLLQIDQNAPDEENMNLIPSVSGSVRYETGAGAPWLYYIDDTPRDSQVYKRISNGSPTTRSRRGFSVNPAVEVLQKGAYSYFLGKLAAMNNRAYLDCVGKRDPSWSSDCKLKD